MRERTRRRVSEEEGVSSGRAEMGAYTAILRRTPDAPAFIILTTQKPSDEGVTGSVFMPILSSRARPFAPPLGQVACDAEGLEECEA
jgi:hypothetical protein